MPGFIVDERAIREEARRQACEQMGWSIELGRKVFREFAIALRKAHERREREAALLAQADKRRSRKAAGKAVGGR